ncbi:MAG: NosD domain-containing protein [Saprospiraceae bacterium]
MKKKYVLPIICFLLVSSLFSNTYHVQPNGSDSNNGLSFNFAFKTIQKATNIVQAGDSVLVYNGMYKGFDHFYKASGTPGNEIVYLAVGANVIINQSCGRGFDGLNVEGSHYIEVNGFKVSKIADASGSGEDGIRAVLANHITIRNCEVDSCYRGIFTGYTDDFLAENNICKRSYGEHGIYVSNNSDRVVVRNNICYGNKAAGVQLNPDLSSGTPGISYDVQIYNNICYNNRIGLNLQGIYHSLVYNNLLYNNGSGGGGNGITLFLGDAATGCKDVKVFNNTVIVPLGSQWCILAIESDSLFLYNNIFLSSSIKGCLDVESSCTNYFGDYNLLNDKMTVDQGSSYINFAKWQSLGHDAHSFLVNDNATVFQNLANNDYHLSINSVALNSGTNLVSGIVKLDLDSLSRPQDGKYDIGCYEKKGITGFENIFSDKKYKIVYSGSHFTFEHLQQGELVEIVDLQSKIVGNGVEFEKSQFLPGIYMYSVINKTNNIRLGSGKIFIY